MISKDLFPQDNSFEKRAEAARKARQKVIAKAKAEKLAAAMREKMITAYKRENY